MAREKHEEDAKQNTYLHTNHEVPERLLNCIETGTAASTEVTIYYMLACNFGLKNLKNLIFTM